MRAAKIGARLQNGYKAKMSAADLQLNQSDYRAVKR